jgi:NADPH:quinone reductase-like Zn-dependent oxidoreductase
VLQEQVLPIPEPSKDSVVLRVRAFGLNHAEAYFRSGAWGVVAKVSGIECVGEIHEPGGGKLSKGQRVLALMGGMGRSINGSYAQYVRVPVANVLAIDSARPWSELAAIPESYATAWAFLRQNLDVSSGQTLLVRGGTSALGQAAINVARDLEVRVLATTRSHEKRGILEALGAEALVDSAELSAEVLKRVPKGVDAVLDIVGTGSLLDSFKMVCYRGRVALAGFLGGGSPLQLDPLRDMPSGMQFSFFASALVFGTPNLPLSDIPFGDFIARAERGVYKAAPAHVFDFSQIVEAHRLIESGNARGKIVVVAP